MKKYLLEPGKNMPGMFQAFVVYRFTEPVWLEYDQYWLEYNHDSSSVMFNLSPAKAQITRWLKFEKRDAARAASMDRPPRRTVVQSWIEHYSALSGVEVLEYKEY